MSNPYAGLTLAELADITEEQLKRTKRSLKQAERAVAKTKEAFEKINWTAVVGAKLLDAKIIVVPEES